MDYPVELGSFKLEGFFVRELDDARDDRSLSDGEARPDAG